MEHHHWEPQGQAENEKLRVHAMVFRNELADEIVGLSFFCEPDVADDLAETIRAGSPIVLRWCLEDAKLIAGMILKVIADAEGARH